MLEQAENRIWIILAKRSEISSALFGISPRTQRFKIFRASRLIALLGKYRFGLSRRRDVLSQVPESRFLEEDENA
jgi:hypothetical protein